MQNSKGGPAAIHRLKTVQLVHGAFNFVTTSLSPVHPIADVAVAPAAAVTPAAACNSAGWEALVEVTEPVLPLPTQLRDLPRNPYGMDTASMASAYNRVLACYMAYGPNDTETQDALVAALERDPSRWVPVLLAGGALAVPELPPLMAMGSKEEASVSGAVVGWAALRCRVYVLWGPTCEAAHSNKASAAGPAASAALPCICHLHQGAVTTKLPQRDGFVVFQYPSPTRNRLFAILCECGVACCALLCCAAGVLP